MNSQYEMQCPFTSQREILYWENRYIEAQSEKRRELERTVIGFKQNVLFRLSRETPKGYLLKTELLEMGGWKQRFVPSKIDQNPPEVIEKITGEVFFLNDDWEKLIKLAEKIKGVGQSVASVILHLYDSQKYPILDHHALRSVRIREEYVRGPTYPFWQEYVNLCRVVADRYDVSMRTLDRALWKYSESGNAERHR